MRTACHVTREINRYLAEEDARAKDAMLDDLISLTMRDLTDDVIRKLRKAYRTGDHLEMGRIIAHKIDDAAMEQQ